MSSNRDTSILVLKVFKYNDSNVELKYILLYQIQGSTAVCYQSKRGLNYQLNCTFKQCTYQNDYYMYLFTSTFLKVL